MERIEGLLLAMMPGTCGHTCRAGGRRGVAHRQRERCVAGRHEPVRRERAGVVMAEGLEDGRPWPPTGLIPAMLCSTTTVLTIGYNKPYKEAAEKLGPRLDTVKITGTAASLLYIKTRFFSRIYYIFLQKATFLSKPNSALFDRSH